MSKPARPFDPVAVGVEAWLSFAVGLAALWLGPLPADKPAERRPAPGAGSEPECADPVDEPVLEDPSTVSMLRPGDNGHSVYVPAGASETCRDCRFYAASNAKAGECRRWAPALADDGPAAEWPITTAGEWCGAFKPAYVPDRH